MPDVATSPADLLTRLAGSAHLDGDRLVIDDEAAFRDAGIRDLAWTAAFSIDEATIEAAQWLIWEASQVLGARSASIQGLYDARARGEVVGLHGPGHQPPRPDLRHGPDRLRDRRRRPTSARSSSSSPGASRRTRSSARSTTRRPSSPVPIAAGWRGPVFLQGDHYQFNAKKYAADPEAMTEEIRRACRLAIDAGYRNIDIDSSTLVDLSKPNVDEEQRENYTPRGRADRADPDARDRRRDDQRRRRDRRGRHEELDRRRAAGVPRRLPPRARPSGRPARARSRRSASRPARRTAGSRCPDGGVAEVKLDFEVLRELGEVARTYGLAGAVQHGASTLPDDAVPPVPGGRDRRDPPGDRLPERAVRAPGVPRVAPSRDRDVVLREPGRRAQAEPDRPAVRLHEPQEGDRAVQAPALGPRDEGRDPRLAATQDRATCSASSASTTRARWSTATSRRSSSTGRSRIALREAVAEPG